MRVVLYAHDMEPITILQLRQWQYDFLARTGRVRLAVTPPVKVQALSNPAPMLDASDLYMWQVEITAEKLHRNGEDHMMLFTRNEEQALLMKAAFLPGQQHALKERDREAFAKGFLFALERMGG